MPIAAAHAACLADRRPARDRQGDARLPDGALRLRASGSGRADVRNATSLALAARSSGGPPRRRARPQRPARARAHRRRQRQAAHRDPGRRRAPHDRLLRLDRGRGGLARLHRRLGRRAERRGRQRAAEDPRGAAGKVPAAGGEPRAGPAAADHPLALPAAHAAAARRRRMSRARSPMRSDATPARPTSRPRRSPPTAASRARSICWAAPRCRCASGSTRCSAALPAVDPRGLHALGDALGARRDRVHGLRRCGARLAQRPADRAGRAGAAGALRRRVGQAQPRGARRECSISSASRWFSTCSAGLPRPRAVDTYRSINPIDVDMPPTWSSRLRTVPVEAGDGDCPRP